VAGDGYFAEHSTPRSYLQSNLDLLGGPVLRFPPGPLVGVDPAARVHPAAEIVAPVCIAAGAEIGAGAVVGPHVVVGDGAVIEPGARVERSVVWSRARVAGDRTYQRCIVTPRAIVDAT
jgi:NDP-sugar pyrophosphorylase family protein